MHDIKITVLICSKGPERWVAQGVEYDIAAQAKSLDALLYEFSRTLNVQVAMDIENGRVPLEDVPPAPERYHQIALTAPRVDSKLPRFQMPSPKKKINRVFPRAELRLCPT